MKNSNKSKLHINFCSFGPVASQAAEYYNVSGDMIDLIPMVSLAINMPGGRWTKEPSNTLSFGLFRQNLIISSLFFLNLYKLKVT